MFFQELKLLEPAMEQHHRAAEERGAALGILWSSPWLKTTSARVGCLEIFPVIFWISPQHLSTTCSSILTIKMKRCFVIFKQNFLCFNLCPLLLVTEQHSESSLSLFFTLLSRCFYAWTRSLWAFLSLCWTGSALWGFPCMNDVSLLSLWPSTGLTPASPFPLTKLHMPGVASPVLKEDSCHLLGPAGSSAPNTAQDAAGHLCCKGTLLAHSQLFAHWNIQVLLCQHPCPCEGWCPAELPEVPLCHPSSSSRCLWLAAHPRGVSAPAPVLHHQQTCWCSTLSQSPCLFWRC